MNKQTLTNPCRLPEYKIQKKLISKQKFLFITLLNRNLNFDIHTYPLGLMVKNTRLCTFV